MRIISVHRNNFFFDMCVNKRWIKNPYTRKWILVKCNHCPACLTENARHRAGRIKNNVYPDQVSLFCTLTYANECLPYVLIEDLENKVTHLPVYRDSYVRRIRVSGDYEMKYHVKYDTHVLDTFVVDDKMYDDSFVYKSARNKPGCVGVCYYKDIQDFFKRLDINLKRRYGFKGKYSRFACHEYGTRGCRPHFHLVVFCSPMDVQVLKSAINEAWPFDRGYVRHRKCELTKGSVANYVASYVNSFATFHPLLSSHTFRSRCSYSRGFGLAPQDFSIDKICDTAAKGNLEWSFETLVQRVPQTVTVSVPKYVINRHFPKFKGYSRLSSDQVFDVLQKPERLRYYGSILEYSLDDYHREIVKLRNARSRYKYPLRFAHDYLLVWSVHQRSVLRSFYESLTNTQFDYDNIYLLKKRPYLSRSLLPLLLHDDLDSLNPNKYPQNVVDHNLLLEEYRNRQKHKEVNQIFFEHNDYEQLI